MPTAMNRPSATRNSRSTARVYRWWIAFFGRSCQNEAVSKWERGQSLPDISLLVPLAECLDVTVTELLEGQRLGEASLPAGQVEELLKKTLALSDDRPEREQAGRGKRFFVLLAAAMGIALQVRRW